MASHTRPSLTQQITVVQWVLPLMLFLVASSYETVEHILQGKEGFSVHFGAEILVFGTLGPMAVWWVLGWVGRNQVHLEQANAKIRQLNTDLERRVAERTAELAEKNAALTKANTELQALDRLKSDFVSLVSHELRAPLTNINGGIEVLNQEREVLSPARREALDILRDESARLTKLVQNILDVSLLEAGRLVPNPGPLPLRPFLNQLLKGRLAADGPHQVAIDVPPDLPPAWVDETHLADVIVNLVDNAVKYSPAGGEIRVTARNGRQELVLSVSDQGIGVPPEEQPHLFERFYRANNSADREVYGHGLGLYYCRKLIEAQNGRIWVESEGVPGRGTTFHVSLPLCPEHVNDE
ncbi:MAG: sensor histidine kinase [Anaerolineae bacterium]